MASNSKKAMVGGVWREEMAVVQRSRAIESMGEERSSAVMWDIEGINSEERILSVLRPVPVPSLCYVSFVF